MSLTNAISAIAVVGSTSSPVSRRTGLSTALGAIAVFASVTTFVSGFLITDRMLKMFRSAEIVITTITQLSYLAAATLFIFSLRWLSRP